MKTLLCIAMSFTWQATAQTKITTDDIRCTTDRVNSALGSQVLAVLTGGKIVCVALDAGLTLAQTGPNAYVLSAGAHPAFVDAETPAGAIDGANTAFTLSHAPSPLASLAVYRNGLQLRSPTDYTV